MFLRELAQCVDAARVRRSVLGRERWEEDGAVVRVARFEKAGGEIGLLPRRGPDASPRLGVDVRTVAVDDHRRREDESLYPMAGERRQELGGREDVGTRVRRRVPNPPLEANLGCEMADDVDTGEGSVEHLSVGDVAADVVSAVVRCMAGDRTALLRGRRGIEHADLPAFRQRRANDRRADESGAPRDKDPHRSAPALSAAGGTPAAETFAAMRVPTASRGRSVRGS